MEAVVYTGPLMMRMLDVPEPSLRSDEVLVEVRAVGICGSELEGFASASPFRVPPLIMGHEIAGVRVDTGERVVVNPLVSCLRCDLCDRGLVNVCRSRQILGIQRPGGFAALVAVPEANCFAAPEGVPFTTLALTEPLANAVHALRLVQQTDPWPRRIGIIGAGAVGLALGLVAKARGIPWVELSDPFEPRLVAPRKAGLVATASPLRGEYDAVFDTVGLAATRGASLALVRPGGTAVWVGLHGSDADVDSREMIRTEKRVLSSFCYDRADFQQARDFVGSVDADWVDAQPMSDGAEVFVRLVDGPVAAVKTVLTRS